MAKKPEAPEPKQQTEPGQQAEAPAPGSRAFTEENAPAGMKLPDRYTNEGVEEYNEGKEKASAYVLTDEFENNLMGGNRPLDEIAQPYVEANPERAFRWLTKQHVATRGTRGYQPVIDPRTGKKVTHLNEDRYLGSIPKHVKEERLASYQEKSNRARQQARERMIEEGRKAERDSEGAIRILPPDRVVAGVGMGIKSTRGHRVE